MAVISAQQVKALRDQTGCGMMECKKALVETDGDMEKAVVILREKGLATAAKKASRIAAEGYVGVYNDGKVAAIVEVNCETDFVAKNPDFIAFANDIAALVASSNPADIDTLNASVLKDGQTVEEVRTGLVAVIRENMTVRRFARMEGNVATYLHMGGKIGVVANFTAPMDAADGKSVCMQIASMNPAYLGKDNVPAEVIEGEKAIMVAQMQQDPKFANKPAQVLDKIVSGKLGKFYSENCLLEQEFILDETTTVGKFIASHNTSLVEYARFERGEGIEKKKDDFAAEVAAMAGGNN
ncbi:MAG: elongation factor Ts [Clostridia bacterium]|nr:elongation factor Ts [Clostridia bacterium]